MDIEQIREGLVMFGVAPWESGLPEPEYDEGHSLMKVKRICRDGIYDIKKNETL